MVVDDKLGSEQTVPVPEDIHGVHAARQVRNIHLVGNQWHRLHRPAAKVSEAHYIIPVYARVEVVEPDVGVGRVWANGNFLLFGSETTPGTSRTDVEGLAILVPRWRCFHAVAALAVLHHELHFVAHPFL